ncbi:hypothetical protein [Streptomyces sp. NPDC101132]|uniref:hypothetical protein n=1 Tax=Streptomyces sp. NPDC101132 TaxID=3366110 RepID=UPI00382579AB
MTSALTFADIYTLQLAKLHDAVTDWGAMAGKLETLSGDARSGMLAKANAADWRGVNADVTKPFIGKTAKEFSDAAAAAKGIGTILGQGYAAFKHAQDQLKKIVSTEAPAQQLVVDVDSGKVRAADPLSNHPEGRHDPDYDDLVRKEAAAVKALQRRIDAIVETCDDADQSMARALRANITDDAHDFSPPKYDSLDAEEAQRAADLAKKGRELTHEELVQLNELLRDNHGAPAFSTHFYGTLGPRKALELFGQLSTDTYDYTEVNGQRLKDVQELQRNLGLNLATATDPDHKPHLPASFGQELRRLGTERIMLHEYDRSGAFGYQLLSGIMRYGDYDARFLNPIAEHAAQLHAEDPYRWADTKPLGGYPKNMFNPSGLNGAGFDPMTGFLEALGHSPDAAKEFFRPERDLVAYNEDGTKKSGAPDLGKDADGNPIKGYLDYFGNDKYKTFPDIEIFDPEEAKKALTFMPDALGHALEAATLGHAWDDPNPKLLRDAGSARVMELVAAKYGGDAGLLKDREILADSLGRMTAGYIDDVNWALHENQDESVFAPQNSKGELHAKFGREGVRDLLSALGQHPDAYASVSAADRIYSSSVLETAVRPDGTIDEGRARATIRTTAEVQGMLDESRAGQLRGEAEEVHKEYERAQAQRAAWIEFGTGAAVAAGVAFLPATAAAAGAAAILVPLAVDTGSGAIEQVAGQVIGDWSDDAVDKHQDEIDEETHTSTKTMFQAGERSAEAPMERFFEAHKVDRNSNFGNDLIESMRDGYQTGNSRAAQQGHEAETGK